MSAWRGHGPGRVATRGRFRPSRSGEQVSELEDARSHVVQEDILQLLDVLRLKQVRERALGQSGERRVRRGEHG